MRPEPSRVLAGVTMALAVQLPPDIRTPFGQALAQMAGGLTYMLAVEMERIIDRLNVENHAIAAILRDSATLVPTDLATRIGSAAGAENPADLKLSTLQSINDRLRALLLETHVAVERGGTPEANAMDARIWDELRESTRRRHIEVPR